MRGGENIMESLLQIAPWLGSYGQLPAGISIGVASYSWQKSEVGVTGSFSLKERWKGLEAHTVVRKE